MQLSEMEKHLLNDFQHGFPLNVNPFKRVAEIQNSQERVVLNTFKNLQAQGLVSRIGPVFSPNSVGVSTLAAMAVPEERLEEIAALVSKFREVNHNYEREHRFNLWFVVTAENSQALQHALKEISAKVAYPLISLPLLRDYHIDLGFKLNFNGGDDNDRRKILPIENRHRWTAGQYNTSEIEERVIGAIQSGLPLVERPYESIAEETGLSEQQVLNVIVRLVRIGVIKRWGVVVRHHELGYSSNAMVVWDIPDHELDSIAGELAKTDCVTLCYERPRRLPHWRYNLFCMIHGKDRERVLSAIDAIRYRLGLENTEHQVLFSKRRFKQKGATYRHSASRRASALAGSVYG